MKCIACGSEKVHKNSTFHGRQRYRCYECKKQFTGTSYTEEFKRSVVKYYKKHGSMRKVAEKFGLNFNTVAAWNKKYG